MSSEVHNLLQKAINFTVVDTYADYQAFYKNVYLARQRLEEMGEAAVDDLVGALEDSNPKIRQLAAEILGKIGDPRAIDGLRECLNLEYDEETARSLREALSRLNDPEHIAALLTELAQGAETERAEAVRLLAKTRDENLVSYLIRASRDADLIVRVAAVKALGYSRANDVHVIPHLTQALQDESHEVRRTAVTVLNRNKTNDLRILDSLLDAAQDEDVVVRKKVIASLQEIGSERAVPVFMEGLSDPEPQIQETALRALYTMIPPQAYDVVIDFAHREALHGNRPWYWITAAILGEIGNPRAIDTLLQFARREDEQFRKVSFAALLNIGDTAAVDPLIEFLSHKEGKLRARAAYVLGKLGDDRALEDLIHLRDFDESGEVSAIAAQAIETMAIRSREKTDFDALIANLELLEKSDLPRLEKVRETINDLANLADLRAVDPLCVVLQNTFPSIRRAAAQALTKLGDPRAIPALEQAIHDPIVSVRLYAQYGLETLH